MLKYIDWFALFASLLLYFLIELHLILVFAIRTWSVTSASPPSLFKLVALSETQIHSQTDNRVSSTSTVLLIPAHNYRGLRRSLGAIFSGVWRVESTIMHRQMLSVASGSASRLVGWRPYASLIAFSTNSDAVFRHSSTGTIFNFLPIFSKIVFVIAEKRVPADCFGIPSKLQCVWMTF